MPEPDTNKPVWDEQRLASVHEQHDKARRVRNMFDAIAPTYERINRIFSGGRDRAWRKRTVAAARVRPGDRILDIACGTGDLLRTFHDRAPQAERYVGVDFAHEMLQRAAARSRNGEAWCEGDGLKLPFASQSFDVTSCAFGVRNYQDLDAGLREMHRVLRPGGRIAILEFTRPANPAIRVLHEFYSGKIMPAMATLMARDRSGAYRYLPRSVVSFLDAEELCGRLRAIGFSQVRAQPLTFGVVTIYTGTKDGA
ncbi:MAG: bifunctional demethylmenaquinone methyltransferase/2-methoxy-6-polyprenyl-1,4-benzoquinol methylase UbiE [Phycisphaerales bacterium]|nr:bifunctional demethylmenaquinone methyltransferase/2-methoxy-6-polyprenyl-1,4-benzoquinol methylase UbiE [Phycisphaerales bacterium]